MAHDWLEYQRTLAAQQKTLEVLMDRVVATVDSSGWDMDQTRALLDMEQAVWQRTAQLEAKQKELLQTLDDLHKTQGRLLQSQKLEAVGQLAAGVAHEINTPVQYIGDSLAFVQESFHERSKAYNKLKGLLLENCPHAAASVADIETEADLEYMLVQVPKALNRATEGLGRVATIVRSMKTFAHPDDGRPSAMDLKQNILATLEMARSEYKYVAELSTDLEEIPHFLCHIGELNQVVLNLVVNAAHAVGARVQGTDLRGKIAVSCRLEKGDVVIEVADTGTGIPAEVQNRIFDPFFTTKEPGKGTGQGLAISRKLVVAKMKGDIWFDTKPGQGTSFFVRLPFQQVEGIPS